MRIRTSSTQLFGWPARVQMETLKNVLTAGMQTHLEVHHTTATWFTLTLPNACTHAQHCPATAVPCRAVSCVLQFNSVMRDILGLTGEVARGATAFNKVAPHALVVA